MTLDEYQQAAARTRNEALDDRGRLLDAAAGLAEEAGEVLGHVRKHAFMGHALDRAALASELGDALWCLSACALTLDMSLAEVAEANLAKLRSRYPDGYSHDRSRTGREPDDR